MLFMVYTLTFSDLEITRLKFPHTVYSDCPISWFMVQYLDLK